MIETPTRTAAFARFFERDKIDLFDESKSDPRSLAINKVISESVECWLADDMDNALHLVQTAEQYLIMTDDEFTEE